MTRRERVIMALNHQQPDFVPYSIGLTMQAEENLAAYTGQHGYLNDKGMHMHSYQFWGWPTEIVPGTERFLDDFGVTWNRTGADKDIGVVENPRIYEPDMALFPEPFLNEERLRADLEELVATREDMFVAPGIGYAMFERLWSYQGMEDAMVNMVCEPEFTEELLDRICEFDMRVLDIMLEYPIDGIYFGDDWGQQKGLIMGPDYWRRFIKPRVAKLYAKVKSHGKYVLQHSCGDIHELFGDLIDMGLDCYQTFQPEIYDIHDVKREYGDHLTFWGGISTQQMLPFATPERVKEETWHLMEVLGKNGGYIAAPTHAVPFDVPAENILAMLDAMQHQP